MSPSGFSQTPAQKRAMEKLMQEAAAKVQPQANAMGQDVIRAVDDAMRGRPVEEVHAELKRRLIAKNVRPSPGLREYAVAISEGTLKR